MLFLAVWKMSAELQSYVISKRLKLQISAWSRFVEFLKLFKMLMDFKWKVCAVFSQSWKTERPVFILAIVTYWLLMRLWLFKTGVCKGEKTVKYTIFTANKRHALTACFWHQIIHNVNAIRWNCYMNMSEAYLLRFS